MEMRTVKHQLKPLSVATEQKNKFLDVVHAYQFEKNYFSDQLLSHNNEVINLQSSYIQIRDKLVKNNYQSKYNLPSRLWKMALKEAYDLHIRTHESQIDLIKRKLNNNIYQYCNYELIKPNQDEDKAIQSFTNLMAFEKLLYFVTNSLFYNFKTFCRFEAEYFSKKFKTARIYQRAKTILLEFLKSKAVDKEVLTKEEAKQLKQLLESNSDTLFNRLFEHYCYSLVKAIQKFRSYKPIQSQINQTITLDGDCYNLYSQYDEKSQKNRWFLDIMSIESGKRIKGLELTGFHHAKQIMKHRKSANLTLSFDPTDVAAGVSAHFTFPVRKSVARKKTKNKKYSKKLHSCSKKSCSKIKQTKLETLTTIGGDFGLTECFTFSDCWVAGREQRDILKKIADNTKKDIEKIQLNSPKSKAYFGLEKNNPTNRRNHTRNCFNHNSDLKNINTNYRKRQKRYNSYLENYKHQIASSIIEHFTTNNEFGDYGCAYENKELHLTLVTLVFEDLNYINLGRSKDDKRQINLIKGVLTLLEEKIKLYNLPIKIEYVNPAYTSQSCPNCYYVDRENRNSSQNNFRCQHCGFTANEDERYKELTRVIQVKHEHLPSEDDFVAACNIAKRLSVLPSSIKLHQRKIKELLMEMHEQVKGSCKMFTSVDIECC
jgi:hypothetical protein